MILSMVLLLVWITAEDKISSYSSRMGSLSGKVRLRKYPRRENMGDCPPLYGNVTIFVAYTEGAWKKLYRTAQKSLECYLKTVNYTLLRIDLDSDPLVKESCSQYESVFYKKHCAALVYLQKTDWLLVIDADTGVVNPNHCIEEWIDDRVSVILYERFFNGEFAAGNYLVKNTPFGRKFLQAWADYDFRDWKNTWHGNDQGGLMLVLHELLLPEAVHEYRACEDYWRNATGYSTFMRAVTCVRQSLGSRRLWPGKIRFYRKFHSFVRDGWASYEKWTPEDFMIHGWKKAKISDSPFSKDIDPAVCGKGLRGWPWKSKKQATILEMRKIVKGAEGFYRSQFPVSAKVIPYLDKVSVADCYPNCETY